MTWVPVLITMILVIVIVAFLYRKNNIGKDRYDERQELLRIKAYKWSAMTMMFVACAYFFMSAIIKKSFMVEGVGGLIIALIGVAVFAIYSIFSDSFFPFRDRGDFLSHPRAYTAFIGLMTLWNGYYGVRTILNHELIENGLLTYNVTHLAVSVLFLAILIALGIKYLMNRNENRSAEL